MSSENGGAAAAAGTSKMSIPALGAKVNFFEVDSKDRMLKSDSLWAKFKSQNDESKLMQFLLSRDVIEDLAHLKLNTVAKVGRKKRSYQSYQSQRYYPPIPPENILVVVSIHYSVKQWLIVDLKYATDKSANVLSYIYVYIYKRNRSREMTTHLYPFSAHSLEIVINFDINIISIDFLRQYSTL